MGAIEQIRSLPLGTTIGGLVVLSLLYLAGLAVYRLYLSPLAKFPGPKLAALSKWYEFYYDVVLKGQYTFKIQELHKIYGPIVRISPHELHINKSSYWETLYVKYPKQLKYDKLNARFGNESSMHSTCDPDLHRNRRGALNSMFSKRVIGQQEPLVQERMSYLSERLKEYHKSEAIVPVHKMWSAYTCDIVTEYAFGFHHNQLGSEDFVDTLDETLITLSGFGAVFFQFPWLAVILNSLPDSLVQIMNPALKKVFALQRDWRKVIRRISQEQDGQEKQPEKRTIFHEILRSDLPSKEKTDSRLGHEAQLIIGAGIVTTAWSLTIAVYYILANPAVLQRLCAELFEAIPDTATPGAFLLSNLEQLPYLRGCIKEGVRLSHGVASRLPRVMDFPLQFEEWTIPPRTPVSMTISDVSFDEALYPKPHEFIPERWGGNPKAPDGESMEKYFVTFSKGPRSCLGINLAYMELYVGLARFFRQCRCELYETDVTDVEMKHDFFIPSPRLDSKGVRMKVLEVEI